MTITWDDALRGLAAAGDGPLPLLDHRPRASEVGCFADEVRNSPRRVVDGDLRMKPGEHVPWGTLVRGKVILASGLGWFDGSVAEGGFEGPTSGTGLLRARYSDYGHGRKSGKVLNLMKGAVATDNCLGYGGVDLIHATMAGRREHRNWYGHSCRYIDHDPGQGDGPSHNDLGQAVHPQGQVVVINFTAEAWSFHGDTETVTRDPASNPHRGDKTGIASPAHGYQTSGFLSGKGQGSGTYLELAHGDLAGNYNQAVIWQGKAKFTDVRIAGDTGVKKYRPRVLFGAAVGKPGVTIVTTGADGLIR